MKESLRKIAARQTLTEAEAEAAMLHMMSGEAEDTHIAGFLMGLRSRGETLDEMVGFTRAMRKRAVPVMLAEPHAVDLCGTGGDGSGTFNISTAAAFVCAGAGATVAKHGNRSVSSKSGSADVLEALGVNTDLGADGVEHCLSETGIAFLFAPNFHPAMRHVMPVRRALGVRTCFNILGPLCNPAGVRRQLVGAFHRDVAFLMAQILSRLGAEHVVAVHSDDGLDEISLAGETTLFHVSTPRSEPVQSSITPDAFGLSRASASAIQGGSATENAELLRDVFHGKAGPHRDVVMLNAAYGLLAAGSASEPSECLMMAVDSIDSGAAAEKLEALVEASHYIPNT